LALSVKDAWLAMLMSLKKLLPRVEVPVESSTLVKINEVGAATEFV